MSKKKVDWIIHIVGNGIICEECGDVERGFKENLCNAHTHGMSRYSHPDFQMVLATAPHEIGRILNSFGLMVQNGYRFTDGEYVTGIYEDCAVRVQKFWETDREVFRVIIPDRNNIFPEDPNCEEPYCHQLLKTSELEEDKMTDQEKIRKLAKDLCLVKENCNDVCNPKECCAAYKHAKKAVEAGYSPKPEMTDSCQFCAELADTKDNAEYYRQRRRNSGDYVDEYTAALVSQSYYNGEPTGRVTSYNHTLNYCPECGKLLMEAKYESEDNNS